MKKLKAVFFGTPDFSVASLQVLHEHPQIELLAVISMPDRASGRGKKLKSPAVIDFAKNNDIQFFQSSNINKDDLIQNFLNANEIDFYLVIAFAQFLNKATLSIPKIAAFNIHTSLLPKYRGAAPIQYALLNGDTLTGVSIQRMVSKMDAGDICYEHTVDIDEKETAQELFKKLESQAALGLKKFCHTLVNNNVSYKPQDESLASFAPTIQKKDGLINPLKENASLIINKFRAYNPWPGTFIYFNDFRLKIIQVELDHTKNLYPGEICTQVGLVIGCLDGQNIRLSKVQLDGKKPIEDFQFLNGIKNKNIKLSINEDYYE